MTQLPVGGPAATTYRVTSRAHVTGRVAVPAYLVTDGRATEGGPSQQVYYVSDAEIAAGEFIVSGDVHPIPIVAANNVNTEYPPIPIYVVNPSLIAQNVLKSNTFPNMKLWLKRSADTYQDNLFATPATTGDPLGGWKDQSGNNKHATQTNASKKPTLTTWGVDPDGSADAMQLVSGISPAGSQTCYAVVDIGTKTSGWMLDAGAGRLIFYYSYTSKYGWYDGGFHHIASSLTGKQIVTWILTSGGNGEMFINGVSIGTAAYSAASIDGSGIYIFSDNGGTGSFDTNPLAELICYSGAHDAPTRQWIETYLSQKYSITLSAPITSTYAATGTSITYGQNANPITGAYAPTANALSQAYWTEVRRALTLNNGGRPSSAAWYGLIKLPSVIDANTVFVTGEFINNAVSQWSKDTQEAWVRRVITLAPNAKIVGLGFLEVADRTGSDATNLRDTYIDQWEVILAHYGLPCIRYDDYVKDQVDNHGATLANYFTTDNIHPSDTGHAAAAALLYLYMQDFTANYTTPLPDRLYAGSADHEYAPQIVNGTSYTSKTGTWTEAGGKATSSDVNATITFSGTFRSIGIDPTGDPANNALNPTVAISVDSGAYSNQDIWINGYDLGARSAHTVTIKVLSGTVNIRYFLAI